jgi:pilus assembly protein CpaB
VAIDDILAGGQRNKRDSGSRRSGSRAIIFWGVALMAGAGSAGLIKWYLDKRHALAPAMTHVVVAAGDLPLATALKPEHLHMVMWPRSARPADTFADAKELVGRVLVTRLVKGEPVLASKIARREAGGGLAALIPANMRAAAVRVDDVVGVAGFIHPEDRVDVLVTLRPQQGQPESKVILQNVKVLAVGKQLDGDQKNKDKGKTLPVTVATLLVTPEQSEKLALAASEGKLLLTLRSWTDEQQVETEGVVAADLLNDGNDTKAPAEPVKTASDDRSSRRSRRPDKVAKVETAPAAKKDVVEILRGDRFEERKFEGKEAP